MTASRSFPRRIDALEQLFDFTAQALPDGSVSAALRRSVDFVLEEYFTNIVKYGGGQGPIGIDIDLSTTGVAVAVTEPDAHFFDVTKVPAIDTTLPIGERQPGGLGLYLARRMVDTLRYDYAPEERLGRITFTIGIPPASAGQDERSRHAGH